MTPEPRRFPWPIVGESLMNQNAIAAPPFHPADAVPKLTTAAFVISRLPPTVAGADHAAHGQLRRGGERLLHRPHRLASADALARLRHLHHVVRVPDPVLLLGRQPGPRREAEHPVETRAHGHRVVVGHRAAEEVEDLGLAHR